MQIVLCKNCEGSGEAEANNRDGNYKIICEECHGSGRLYVSNGFKIPFTADKNILSKIVSKSFEKHRELDAELRKAIPVPKKIQALNKLRGECKYYSDYLEKVKELERQNLEAFYNDESD
jgi:hypothetical protein